MAKIEYYNSRGLYTRFFVNDKEYQVLPSKLFKGSPYQCCKYCKSGFGDGKTCPQFICPDDILACSCNDRRDGEEVYFEWDVNKFVEPPKSKKR